MAFEQGPHLERVKRNDNRRWPMLAIGLGIVLVALAFSQPWARTKPPGSDEVVAASPQGTSSAGQVAEPAVGAIGLYAQCFPTIGWRVTSLQQSIRLGVRTAWPVATTAQPDASAVNTPRVFGRGVEAIGFCTPGMDELTRSQYVGDVSLWRRTDGGAIVEVADAGVLDPELAAQGEVYLTPPASISTNGTWPPGDYYFQLRPRGSAPGTITASARWLAMRLVPASPTQSPRPTPVPRSTPSHTAATAAQVK